MNKQKGIAYCGLACSLCNENTNCAGCRNEGCIGKDWCKNFICCKDKGLNGCWECEEFPCDSKMYSNPRVRAFAKFIKEYGEEELLKCLARNETNGVVYHYEGKLNGDYDLPESEEDIILLIKEGK